MTTSKKVATKASKELRGKESIKTRKKNKK